ncbi:MULTISPECIES: thioredoxin family protein [Halomonadaceae]|uniref:thioredoxin family protein n=1 Tax=Halomonadaceae TaxID=28256 RepID=UPI0015983651|nr:MULTISPECIES: thioredoxin family protein [Halomonas]QJQ96306.1 thioredoxin family protein [Halomonas sp. PA5]
MNTHYASVEPAREEVDAMHGPTVIEFGTPWCGFCIDAQPKLDMALSAYPDVRHLKIEDGRGRRLGRSFRVKLWPTLIFMSNGEEVTRVVRPASAEAVRLALERIAD